MTVRKRAERGFTTVEWLAAVTFSILLLILLVNLIAVQYGRGVLRAAADEGARSGARAVADPQAACEDRVNDVLDGLGKMAQNVQESCVIDGGQIRTQVSATFEGWLPMVPNLDVSAHGSSASEKARNPQ